MTKRVVVIALACWTMVQAQQLMEIDRVILSRGLRREYMAALKARTKTAEMMNRTASALSTREPERARRLLLESMAEWKGIQWTGAHTAVAGFHFRIAETVVEPGSNLHAVVERLGAEAPVEGISLVARLKILNRSGETVVTGRERPIEEMVEVETPLAAPVAEGTYSVVLSVREAGSEVSLAEGRNVLWVVTSLRSRLAGLTEGARAGLMNTRSPAGMVWLNTILGIAQHYSAARSASVRSGWQFGSPMVQTLVPTTAAEPLNPLADIAWAERALVAAGQGQSPAVEGGGWIPIAAPGPPNGGLHLARVWWPPVKPTGIVLLLGDVFSHERSWEDIRPPGAFLCVAAAFRLGEGWEHVEGLLDAVEKVTGGERKAVHWFAHGAGAAEGLDQAEKKAARFASVAALGPLTDRPLAALAQGFPPFLLMAAESDELMPAETLRRASLVLERRLEKFEYLLLPGVNHEAAREPALAKALDFFSAIAAGTWKRPGERAPAAAPRPQ